MKIGNYVLVLLCCCNFLCNISAQSTHPSEVDALRAVRRNLIDANNYLKSWRKGDPCSSNWTGVWCLDKVGPDGYFHVQELQLMNLNLSGSLAPELGQLSYLERLDFMWNQITGSIPKEIGNISSLKLLVLNGNQLSGSLPDELGLLSKLIRLQLDENNLSGPIPKSFANMSSIRHFHLNNNSFSGQLPHELSQLPDLYHLLLDNNNLSGDLPSQYSALSDLEILQLDNNNFAGAEIPESYQNLSKMVKISLRNCSLGGQVPDLSHMPELSYIDLSCNKLTGFIPPKKLSENITTIDLSHNMLNGSIPESLSDLPSLQMLCLENNSLQGSVPASIWHSESLNGSDRVAIDLRYNMLSDISGDLNPPNNVTVRFRGNPVCNDANIQNIHRFCDSDAGGMGTADGPTLQMTCPVTACPVDQYFEPVPAAPTCFCAAPIGIGFRLKSPSFSYFPPYILDFERYITQALKMEVYQLFIDSYAWDEGPRLRMNLKLFPNITSNHVFNASDVRRIMHIFTTFRLPPDDLFGPYELLYFTLIGPYASVNSGPGNSGIKKSVLATILVALAITAVTASVAITCLILTRKNRDQKVSRKRSSVQMSIKFDGIKDFTFKELSQAADSFSDSAQVGQGGYGKVYRGILADESVVAVKRAEEGSMQGTREFLTEIQLLSRLHHRNLVPLVGYCCQYGEQILVYEFMSNGTLREWLSGKLERTLNFVKRLRIALGASKGILYLHTEANPPIFHRDIKASNILLDSHLTAKVADFGLSRLAPVTDDESGLLHHVSTVVRGTPGYLDPEYFLTHELTDKSDVYSLGVVFLELLTGVPPISHGKNLVREVKEAHKSGSWSGIIDSRMADYSSECVERFTDLAVRCCQDKPPMRPSMLDIVRELENILQMIPESMNLSDTTSVLSNSSSCSLSLSNNAYRYPHSSVYVFGSDLDSGVLPSIISR